MITDIDEVTDEEMRECFHLDSVPTIPTLNETQDNEILLDVECVSRRLTDILEVHILTSERDKQTFLFSLSVCDRFLII